jgi:hypothetical protein
MSEVMGSFHSVASFVAEALVSLFGAAILLYLTRPGFFFSVYPHGENAGSFHREMHGALISILDKILTWTLFLAVILLPMAAVMYGSIAPKLWLHRYPKFVASLILLLVVALSTAGASFSHLLPTVF